MTSSNILEIAGKRDIGLSIRVGSPFLKRGMTLAIFNLTVSSDLFIIVVNGFNKSELTNLIRIVDNSSTPELFLELMLSISFDTVSSSPFWNEKK